MLASAKTLLLASLFALANASYTAGETVLGLYAIEVGGSSPSLFEVDATNATELAAFSLPAGRQWNDITAAPFDPSGVYAVSLETGTSARRLSRVDTTNGGFADIPLTNGATTGPNPLSFGWWGIAFDPRDAKIGYIGLTVSLGGGGQSHAIARFDLQTQMFEHSVSTTHRWAALAMSANGELIGSVDIFDESRSPGDRAEVYDIDPNTGQTSLRFTSSYRDLTGLAFHPEDGRLFAINAFSSDEVIVIDSESGNLFDVIGGLPTGGPNGLAFTAVPEPLSVHLVIFLGLLGVSSRRILLASAAQQNTLSRL